MKITIDTKWLDAISDLDDTLRLALLDGIFAYLEGRDPILGNEAFRVFCTLKPFIDEEANKRIRLAERSRQNGMKGGRKTSRKEEPEKEEKPKGFLAYLEKPEFQGRCKNLLKLDAWKEKNVPYIYKHIRPLTQREFDLLTKKYSSEQICEILLQIENRKDLRKRYSDPYKTIQNWMKRNYGNS